LASCESIRRTDLRDDGQIPTKRRLCAYISAEPGSLFRVLNIAEGSGRNTDAEFNHFLGIAVGSVFEVVAGLHLAREQRYIDEPTFASLYEDGDKLARKINAFRNTLSVPRRTPKRQTISDTR
jgi:hypothetical protein